MLKSVPKCTRIDFKASTVGLGLRDPSVLAFPKVDRSFDVCRLQFVPRFVYVACHAGKASQNAPELISERLKFKTFPGGACPQTPPSRCVTQLTMAKSCSQLYNSRFSFIKRHHILVWRSHTERVWLRQTNHLLRQYAGAILVRRTIDRLSGKLRRTGRADPNPP